MAIQQWFYTCAYCGREFDDRTCKKNAAHVIPKSRGGCDHLANLVDACEDCNKGEGGQHEMTPIEWWAKQEWGRENTEGSVSMFDAGGWKLSERHEFLLQAAYWEARARWHLLNDHEIEADFVLREH